MGFQLSGAVAAGAAEGLRKWQEDEQKKRSFEAVLAQQLFDQEMRRLDLAQRQQDRQEARERQARLDKHTDASHTVQVMDSMFDPASREAPEELAPDVVHLLSG